MKLLITGGAGFIGSHLCIALLRRGHQLTIIDNLHPYYDPIRKKEQLNHLKQFGSICFEKVDLLSYESCSTIFEAEKFEAVIHLAALPGVAYSIEKPLLYVDYDIKATINVLKLAGETGVGHVVFASSSSVYGDKGNHPLQEDELDGKVISPYAASKLAAESFCHVYQKLYKFQLTILRFFTVYGPWGRPDMGIPIFIDRLIKDRPIEVFGLESARDYTYIDDIVDGIVATLLLKKENEIINIGSGRPVSMNELINILKVHFPNLKVNLLPWRPGDVRVTRANIQNAKTLLNYEPKINIEEGIARTVAWARKNT